MKRSSPKSRKAPRAILHGAGSNAVHGLRRTQADKRRAVERLLKDPEWARWSDRKIAEVARVDHKTVGAIRRELTGNGKAGEFPTTAANGKAGEFPTAITANGKPISRNSVLDDVLRTIPGDALLAECPIRKPDGGQYQNTEGDWKFLNVASLSARYLDFVPFDGIIDRRNGEPMIFAGDLYSDPDEKIKVSCEVGCEEPVVDEIGVPDLPALPCLSLRAGYPVQKYIVDVWIEKSTQNDWLVPLCQRRRVNLMVGTGEQSETRARELALRAARYGAPVRIIYLSDFDPGGRSMPKAVARKIEFTIAKFNLDIDLQLIPVALTPEQCREYQLPRIPIKDSERRKDKFESIFGVGATELDALEALFPGELARLLNAEIDNWIDASLVRRATRFRAEMELLLGRISRDIPAPIQQ